MTAQGACPCGLGLDEIRAGYDHRKEDRLSGREMQAQCGQNHGTRFKEPSSVPRGEEGKKVLEWTEKEGGMEDMSLSWKSL